VKLDVPLAVNMEIAVFWDMTPYVLADSYPGGFLVVYPVTRGL
jgi:hypothetical protein